MNERFRDLSPYRLLRDPPVERPDPRLSAGRNLADDTLQLREYWRTIRKHRGLVASLVLAAGVGTAIATLMMDPLYAAKAILQIEPQAPKVAPVQELQQLNTGSDDQYNYYDTQFKILESHALAARVIRTLGLETEERFLDDERSVLPFSPFGWLGRLRSLFASTGPDADDLGDEANLDVPDTLIGRYQSSLSIQPIGKSRLVEAEFTSRSPRLAAEVVNAHVHEYIEFAIAQRLAVAQRAKELLGGELEKAKSRALMAEAALNKFRKEKGIISVDGDKADIVSERLYDLNKQLTEAQAERIRLESQYKLVERRDHESIPSLLDNPLISRLKEEAARVESERAELENQFFPGYPKLQRAIVREKQAKARLQAEIRKFVDGIKSAYLAANDREAALQRELNEQQHAALAQKDLGAEYDGLRRDAEMARSLSAALLQRLADVDVTRELNVSNISVFDEAEIPTYPSSPKKLLSVTMAVILSSIFGIGLSFLLEHLDNTLKTPADVERWIGLPTLGVVPSFDALTLADEATARARGGDPPPAPWKLPQLRAAREREDSSPGTELVVSSWPQSPIAEAYRTIRTGILLSGADTPPQVTLFTSGAPGEGKTLTSLNLAVTLVHSGARVLLIDADLRKPRLHRVFALGNGHGLSTYLTGQSPLDAAIRPVKVNGYSDSTVAALGAGSGGGDAAPGLFVIPSGPLPPNPAELLGSRRMLETLGLLRQQYDYVIIDAPPVLPVTDVIPLSVLCDAVVLVARGQTTPWNVVAKARDRLLFARARIVGVVLNDVDVTTADYDSDDNYYYPRYYSSSSQDHDNSIATG